MTIRRTTDEGGIHEELGLPTPDPIVKHTNEALPLSDLNWSIVEEMASYLCSVDDIADYLGCTKTHLYNDANGDRLKEIIARKSSMTRTLLRKRQLEGAMSGNGMIERIWLGKQHLGQADKQELTGADGMPLIESGAHAVEKLFELMARAQDARNAQVTPNGGDVVEGEVVIDPPRHLGDGS